ncbi:IclR family transcriptional regulator [Mycolicibacterium komossense]|uniref:IclR family transcriptional regulator n=1 Tax=Mycolicibacterium komossense TaxID=1779 RepID=A0ABT3C7G4_9MYCO|nr:IclR family transcriptional regulator [Mycolicibacterium komossense]MCV7225393.1 IclR family transcriptional regulator [Mycolicibacterium komossense]
MSNDAEPLAGTQSLDRALQVLLRIAEEPPPGLSLAACSSILGYSKPTTQRMLRTLLARNFLAYNEELGVYTLGVVNAQLGSEYLRRLDLRRVALPEMRLLVAETGETAHLGIVTGQDVVYIELVDSPHPVRIFSRVGDAVPAYATAIGKAILAWTEADVSARHVPDVLVPRTANTVRDRDALAADLSLARERGYAIDDQENREGIRGYAAPIFDHTGSVVAAVSIGGPADRVDVTANDRLGNAVIAAAGAISRQLGHRGNVTTSEHG